MPGPSRRHFLGASAAAGLAVATGRAAAEDRVAVAVMGTGGRGTQLAAAFAKQPGVTVSHVCDVDAAHAGKAADATARAGGKTPQVVEDFRRILDDKAVDVLVVAT